MTDVIVIGAGHNGLICAGELAKAGLEVRVLEAAEQPGGLCITREFAPGYQVSSAAHLLVQLAPEIAQAYKLEQNGLQFAARDLSTVALHAQGRIREINGAHISGEGLSADDIHSHKALHAQMLRHARVLATAARERPPTLVNGQSDDLLTLFKLGWRLRRLGRIDMRELLRVGSMNLFDVLNEHLEDSALKGALCLDGVLGCHMGPRSPNTVLNYLARRMGEAMGAGGPGLPLGGMGSVTQALAQSVSACGAKVQTGTEVARILTASDRVVGVELRDGERLNADVVVSNVDPKTTFERLVGFRHVNTGFARRVHNFRARGNTAKLHLALSGRPQFTGVADAQLGARLVVAPDMGYVERAFDHAKYAEYSTLPAMEITLPTVHDAQLAPNGHHVLSAIVQYAPYSLKNGDWTSHKETFMHLLIDLLEVYAPGIRDLITHRELITPADLERDHHVAGGHWHHGELSLDQFMMMRPFPGAAQYTTPIDDLYLCGAGTHPGGGVMGLAGRNAARVIIKKTKG